MPGANNIHERLRHELEDYIRSQYFGKSPLLLSAIDGRLDKEGLLYQKPYIESSPLYKTVQDGIQKSKISPWLRGFFVRLEEAELGVYAAPFSHQIESLEEANNGKDIFVSTGTGSGKTECFLWPLLAKLASEAHDTPQSWERRGIRAIIMYPMNALVSDQVARLRRLIGDPEGNFLEIFRSVCGNVRRPQFGMYTGRTPYPGVEPKKEEDNRLVKTLERMTHTDSEAEQSFYERLLQEGKIPAKLDMDAFLGKLRDGQHLPDAEDAELITRFEMQQVCPDILITNYSMLEYMLMRPRERKIWDDTRIWLKADERNRLLFIVDEAHMYRGASGGEVALLIRRLFHKLGIGREKVQFILTTASMPHDREEDTTKVRQFARDLTAVDKGQEDSFCLFSGETEMISDGGKYEIPFTRFQAFEPSDFEDGEKQLASLNAFLSELPGCPAPFASLDEVLRWMYENLASYGPFYKMFCECRGQAVSLDDLAVRIFPGAAKDDALHASALLLAIAPLARDSRGAVLFPARLHMLFRGIKGVYACTNGNCPHSHSEGGMTLGEVFLSDGRLVCPHCHSAVYELYNDRRCGALFFKGYVLTEDLESKDQVYLWQEHGQVLNNNMKEIHLFVPEDDYTPSVSGKNRPKPCYLDVRSGFINFRDDAWAGKPGVRKLYYCDYFVKGKPNILTFPTCPHCGHQLSQTQLTSFSTKGNEPFSHLIETQFQLQPPVHGKQDPNRFPNEGRKVLLFSDSRQRAAKLARDISEISDIAAARQLFGIALEWMEKGPKNLSMNFLYDYFSLVAAQRHVQIFYGEEREKLKDDGRKQLRRWERCVECQREYQPRLTIENAPLQWKKFLLRVYCGGYNTFYDCAVSWIEPTLEGLEDAVSDLENEGITVSETEFCELFNAWLLNILDGATALGHTIADTTRMAVRRAYNEYGLKQDWEFPTTLRATMSWEKNSKEARIWKQVLHDNFLDTGQAGGNYYIDLSRIRPRFDLNHTWFRCGRCSELTPYPLRGKCPSCGSGDIRPLSQAEKDALKFWHNPIESAVQNQDRKIFIIDTEEHTAQLSHKDQRDNLWARTEEYELRFQDFIQEGETPVDILSSTTTMEVGIDIGSLVAIGLRNIPPMRENYQQRAGRAGRRGTSLSTVVTFCEDGPHDSLYFRDPVPMLRGDPRAPWIDIQSEKLLRRHLNMIVLQNFVEQKGIGSLDSLSAKSFLDDYSGDFAAYLRQVPFEEDTAILPAGKHLDTAKFILTLEEDLADLKKKRDRHPELFSRTGGGIPSNGDSRDKPLLDALYDEGIIPTYSFPKNVVSTYITDTEGRIQYQVSRGLDVAISEDAPGRSIVVDKKTYLIGGLYYPGSEWSKTPARAFFGYQGHDEDGNYLKEVLACPNCGWFGLREDGYTSCPFCDNTELKSSRMLRPWGFAPRNAKPVEEAQLEEVYSSAQSPVYSTLPKSDEMTQVPGCSSIRMATRTNQRIILLNKGPEKHGFMVCQDCGAAMPANRDNPFGGNTRTDRTDRPYKLRQRDHGPCRHENAVNIDLGCDFITDMLVLEFALSSEINIEQGPQNLWLPRAAQSLAESLRLAVTQELDIEFTELVAGYRPRRSSVTKGGLCIDIYLYDSLSSGAGYATSLAPSIGRLLSRTEEILKACDCETACYKCLKHYRNQYAHSMLNRHAALDLLRWGIEGKLAEPLSIPRQNELIEPLRAILECSKSYSSLFCEADNIKLKGRDGTKRIVVYPAMWAPPQQDGVIFISDFSLQYARPYAVEKIFLNP